MARLKSMGSSWGWIALVGLASGTVASAPARRDDAPAVPARRPAVNAPLHISGSDPGAFDPRGDVQSEAAAAALSSGTVLGGEILQPLPAL